MGESDTPESIRVDKWLWAARFFKTRSQAAEAVSGGKVHVNSTRVKPARAVKAGDRLSIQKGSVAYEVVVEGLSGRRGPAPEARGLYCETPESVAARQARRQQPEAACAPHPPRRPDKKARRQLVRVRRSG